MDSTPLHPDVRPLDAQALRHGTYHTAVAYHRRMLRTKFACRVASVVLSIVVLALVGAQGYDFGGLGGWLEGGLVAGTCLTWSLVDIAYVTVRFARWKRRGNPITKDSWGPPGVHVAAQLVICLLAFTMAGVEFAAYRVTVPDYVSVYVYDPSVYKEAVLALQAAIVCFIFLLGIVHFILFVLYCSETDIRNRKESDAIFIPNEDIQERTYIPPAMIGDVFFRRKLPVAYYADHYVRFVPGTDGTLQIARDYSSRQIRV